jgi:hypothetical protein
MEDLYIVRQSIDLFEDDAVKILGDMSIEKNILADEMFKGIESVTKENPDNPNTFTFLPDDFWKKFKANLTSVVFEEIKKILCGDEDSDSLRAKLVKKVSENKINSKSAIVITISMYIASKLGNPEIGVIISSVVVILSKIAQKFSIAAVDSFCKTINEL